MTGLSPYYQHEYLIIFFGKHSIYRHITIIRYKRKQGRGPNIHSRLVNATQKKEKKVESRANHLTSTLGKRSLVEPRRFETANPKNAMRGVKLSTALFLHFEHRILFIDNNFIYMLSWLCKAIYNSSIFKIIYNLYVTMS